MSRKSNNHQNIKNSSPPLPLPKSTNDIGIKYNKKINIYFIIGDFILTKRLIT